jgi:dienelactone hydrolase
MLRHLALAILIATAPLLASLASAFTVATHSTQLGGDQVAVDVYLPEGEPLGVAIVAHGFMRDRSRHRHLGRALAEAGVAAVIPDLPNVANQWGTGDALADFVRGVEHGMLDLPPTPRARVLLIGTSAGGLATVLAASQLPGLGGWIGLDPVDRLGTGVRAAANLSVPAIVMLGEPSTCNLFRSGHSIAAAAPHLVREEVFPGTSHCDFEAPTNRLCRALCGSSRPGMDDVTRKATVAAALDLLGGSVPPPSPQAVSAPAPPAH